MPAAPQTAAETKASELEQVLKDIEADFLATKKRFTEAIRALRGEETNVPIFDAVKAAMNGHAPSRIEAVDKALADFTVSFTTTELRNRIKEKYPTVEMKGTYLATRLTALAEAEKIRLVKAGTDGGPNTWQRL